MKIYCNYSKKNAFWQTVLNSVESNYYEDQFCFINNFIRGIIFLLALVHLSLADKIFNH